MEKLGLIDVKILVLGIKHNDRIDENILEKSELNNSGTGRLLDTLASLIDRNLIKLNEDKSFQITNNAKQILWNKEIPLWVKILRMLQISSLELDKLAGYLNENLEEVEIEIEKLRKNQLVMMSALRKEQELLQVFEILPEGIEELEKIKNQKFQHSPSSNLQKISNVEVFDLLNEITEKISQSNLEDKLKHEVLEKLSKIQSKLEI